MKRLVEADTRRGMVAVNVHVPRGMHRELMRLRRDERLSMAAVIRLALTAWLARRRKGGAR